MCEHDASRLRCGANHATGKALKTINFESQTVKAQLLANAEMNVGSSRRNHTKCQFRTYDGRISSASFTNYGSLFEICPTNRATFVTHDFPDLAASCCSCLNFSAFEPLAMVNYAPSLITSRFIFSRIYPSFPFTSCRT